jgi:AraC-like DNA-binding protein
MHRLGNKHVFTGMTMPVDPTIKTRLLSRPVRSRLGTLRLAGLNKGGVGVGMGNDSQRQLTHYALNYVLGGEGTYRDDAHPLGLPVPAESLVLYFPGTKHSCGTTADHYWDELWFEFEGPVFDQMRTSGLLDPARPVSRLKGRDYWLRRLTGIIPPPHERQQTRPEVTVLHFAHVLADMIQSATASPTARTSEDWVHRACQLLADDEVPAAASEPAQVARRLGLSYESFRKKFREAMGQAPGRYRLEARMDHAVALIYQGRNTLKEISERLGFCDEFYFSRLFKRRFGQSPRSFRKSSRGH